mmetsp:Transcript_25728/g.64806  ORF Transcript_25728/g.64806 Transcript_25728/m.64806 type:complete len:352 (-) Transcript_25728:2606-3661(-)
MQYRWQFRISLPSLSSLFVSHRGTPSLFAPPLPLSAFSVMWSSSYSDALERSSEWQLQTFLAACCHLHSSSLTTPVGGRGGPCRGFASSLLTALEGRRPPHVGACSLPRPPSSPLPSSSVHQVVHRHPPPPLPTLPYLSHSSCCFHLSRMCSLRCCFCHSHHRFRFLLCYSACCRLLLLLLSRSSFPFLLLLLLFHSPLLRAVPPPLYPSYRAYSNGEEGPGRVSHPHTPLQLHPPSTAHPMPPSASFHLPHLHHSPRDERAFEGGEERGWRASFHLLHASLAPSSFWVALWGVRAPSSLLHLSPSLPACSKGEQWQMQTELTCLLPFSAFSFLLPHFSASCLHHSPLCPA